MRHPHIPLDSRPGSAAFSAWPASNPAWPTRKWP